MLGVRRAIPNIEEVESETNSPPEIVSVKVGVGSPYYAGTSGARLEIGALGTDVTGESLFPVVSGGAIIEDTVEQRVDFDDILNKVLGPTIVITSARRPKPSFEAYIEQISKLGYRSEPVVKGKGVPVWVLVSYATKHDMSPAQISRLWNGYVTDQEVQAALEYCQAYPEAVEDKLSGAE